MGYDYLQSLLNKIKENQDSNDSMIKNQVALAGKRFQDPNYTPSTAEAANEGKYYDAVNGAVAGSLGGGESAAGEFKGIKSLLGPEIESGSPLLKKIVPSAEELAAAPVGQSLVNDASAAKEALNAASEIAPYSSDTAMAAQQSNRALDKANRYKQQYQAIKNKVR